MVKLTEDQIEVVIQEFQDKNDRARVNTSTFLSMMVGEPAVEPLIKALDDPSYYVKKGVIEVLGKIGDERAIEPLIARMYAESSVFLNHAYGALEKIAEKTGSDKILRLFAEFVLDRVQKGRESKEHWLLYLNQLATKVKRGKQRIQEGKLSEGLPKPPRQCSKRTLRTMSAKQTLVIGSKGLVKVQRTVRC